MFSKGKWHEINVITPKNPLKQVLLDTLEYKTIRYKGHADKFKLLVDLGLTNKKTIVNVNGNMVKARDVLKEVLTPQLLLGDKEDAVLLRVIVKGIKEGENTTFSYELSTKKDKLSGTTAMARATPPFLY